jgi:cell division protein FtsZ
MLDKKEGLEEENLFSIPVLSETESINETESEMINIEKIESEEVELEDELIASTPAIENMKVVYEILDYEHSEEAREIEMEEEFIINDLDEEVLDLDVVGNEEVEAEEENQFAFDFGLNISNFQEVSTDKIVHTLSEADDEKFKEDAFISEAIDFEFEVVEELKESSVSDMEEVMSSPQDDSPFDKKIKETATKENEERKDHLKKFNHAFKHSMNKIDELEKQPAYRRIGLELDQPTSSESNESRLSVDSDKNDDTQLRSNNSFLHDNVD